MGNLATLSSPLHRLLGWSLFWLTSVFSLAAPPPNDDFVSRVILPAGLPQNVTGSNEEASAEAGEPAHANLAARASVWWEWTAPSTGVFLIDTSGSDFDTVLAVYTGDALNALTRETDNDESAGGGHSLAYLDATSGTRYAIAVDGHDNGAITLNIAQVVLGGGRVLRVLEHFFPNGQISQRIYYYLNESNQITPHGSETIWLEGGTKFMERQWKDGQKDGAETEWSFSGFRSRVTHFKAGVKDGLESFSYGTGFIKSKTHFRNGLKDGLETLYYFNGLDIHQKILERNWMDGRMHGRERQWDRLDGTLISEGNFVDDEKAGLWVHRYRFTPPNQNTNAFEEQTQYLAGVPQEGVLISEDGLDSIAIAYEDGAPTTIVVQRYHPGGQQLESESQGYHPDPLALLQQLEDLRTRVTSGTVLLLTRHGTYKSWYANGQQQSLAHYQDGDAHGHATTWFDNGIISRMRTFANGLRHGLERVWNPDGGLRETPYVEGKIHGVFRAFGSSGRLVSRAPYLQGLRHGIAESFDSKGRLLALIPYHLGRVHGVEHLWKVERLSQEGPLTYRKISQTTFSNGVRHGPFRSFVSPRRDGLYGNGLPCGIWRDWSYSPPRLTNHGPCEALEGGPPIDLEKAQRALRGTVTDESSDDPIEGAKISAENVNAFTDASGDYSVILGDVSLTVLTVEKAGFYIHQETLDLAKTDFAIANVTLKPLLAANQPAIVSVKSLGKYFLGGVQSLNPYTVAVDWNGATPGTVRFNANGTAVNVPTDASGIATKTYDMGSAFIVANALDANTLTITAITATGATSESTVLHPVVLDLPAWSNGLGNFTPITGAGVVKLNLLFTFPDPALEGVLPDSVPGLPTVWNKIGFLRGNKLGFEETQIEVKVAFESNGNSNVEATGQVFFLAGPTAIVGKLAGKGQLLLDHLLIGRGLQWPELSTIFSLQGGYRGQLTPSDAFPPIKQAFALPLIGSAIEKLDLIAKIEPLFLIGVEGVWKIGDDQGAIGFVPDEISLVGELSVTAAIEISDSLEVSFSGGGKPKLTYQVPANPDYLKSWSTEFFGKAVFKSWGFAREYEGSYTLSSTSSFPPPASLLANSEGDSIGWKPRSRRFLESAPSDVFVAPRTLAPGGPLPLLSRSEQNNDQRLVANIFPESQPGLAVLGDETFVVYEVTDPSQPITRATDIGLIHGTPAGYQPVLLAANDTRGEFNPICALDANGFLVVVWERVKDPAFTGDDLEAYAAAIELVFATYDPATLTWSAVQALTDNAVLDHGARLVCDENNDLTLFWIQNAGNSLTSSPATPDQLQVAAWDGAQFGTPDVVPGDFTRASDYAFATQGGIATLAYIMDMDGDVSTPNDSELHSLRRNGANWEALVRLTNDALADANPVLAATANGTELLWRSGSAIRRLTNWSTGASELVRADSDSLSFLDFRPVASCADPRLAICWQASDPSGTDLFYTIYDPASATWSDDLRLTEDRAMDSDFSGVLAGGSVHQVSTKTDPETDLVDLHYLRYALHQDLLAKSILLTPANPAPGDTMNLSATIQNTGDAAIAGARVVFYLGDPSLGTVLGDATLAVLRAGASAQAAFSNWTIPTGAADYRVHAVVDPDGLFAESDETNNTVSTLAVKPDLTISSLIGTDLGDGSIRLEGEVENLGPVDAEDVGVTFSANNTVIDSTAFGTLYAGRKAQVEFVIWPAIQFETGDFEVFLRADEAELVEESNEDNNERSLLGVNVLLTPIETDSDGDGLEDRWERDHFGTLSRDGTGNFDGDESDDRNEFNANTDPRDPDSNSTSTLATGADAVGRTTVVVRWPVLPGKVYRVQVADTPGTWTNLSNELRYDEAGEASYVDTVPPESIRRFYRVITN